VGGVESTTPKEKNRGAAAFLQLDGFRESTPKGGGVGGSRPPLLKKSSIALPTLS
jgi:hypothetical protein